MKWLKDTFSQYKGLPFEIYVLFLCRVLTNMGNFVFPMLSLILTQRVGMSHSSAGTFITMLAVITAPGILIGGKLVDTIGRKKVMVIFSTLGSLVFFTCGFLKPSMTMAYVLILAPIFLSFAMPAQDTMIADITSPRNRKQAFSLLYMGNNLGLSIGPIIGGLLYKNHLSLVFIGDAITTLISLSLVLKFIKETSTTKNKEHISRKLEKSEKGNIIDVLMKRKVLLYFALIYFWYQFSYAQWGFYLPIQLGSIFNLAGASNYGMLSGLNGAIVLFFTAFLVKITHKLNALEVFSIGGLLYCIAFGGFGFGNNMIHFVVFTIIMTFGEIIITINMATFIANHSPQSHRGRVNAVVSLIYSSGYALGPLVVGNFSNLYSIKATWILISSIMFISSIFMILLYKLDSKESLN